MTDTSSQLKLGGGAHGSVYVLDEKHVSKRSMLLDKTVIATYLSDGCLSEMVALHRAISCKCRHLVNVIGWNGSNGKSELILERLEPIYNAHDDIDNRKLFIKHLFEGLYDLHKCGIAHSDIKMDNIMYRKDTHEAVIIDLGLARLDPTLRSDDKVKFTYDYRPPEALLGITSANSLKADVWAAGICAISILLSKYDKSVFHQPLRDADWLSGLLYIMDELHTNLKNTSDLNKLARYRELRCEFESHKTTPSDRDIISQIQSIYGDEGVDWVHGVLNLSPSNRLSAYKALQHPFLRDIDTSLTTLKVLPKHYSPFKEIEPMKAIPSNAFAEIIAACDFEELNYESAFKAFDLLQILPNSNDPVVMAIALFLATSVGEHRLINANRIIEVMAPWADMKECCKLIERLIETPGVIAALSTPSVYSLAMRLRNAQINVLYPKCPDEIATKLVSKYIELKGNKPKSIDILDCI